MLMKHGATREQALSIMDAVHGMSLPTRTTLSPKERSRERSYQMAKWAIAKAKEYGTQNAATTMGHRE
jgi:hypothetical protein